MWGCAKKQVVKPQEQVTTPPPVQEQTKEEPSVRFTDWTEVPQLKVIRFNYDSSDLSDDARATLKTNAEFMKSNPDLMVLVEGHCDERGTTEYNLALGQRRASSVRDYYGKLGVPLGRIGTISYGEEMPVDPAHDENAWAKNRRAETKVRTPK
jgi:peptidoglycan-associated lipoprotein